MPVEPTWWEKTFGPDASTPEQLEDRIRRLEADLRAEQDSSSDSRKRATAIVSRIERAKDALEMVLVALAVTTAIIAGTAIYQRYTGWEFVIAWLSFGALAIMLYRDAFKRIRAI